MGQCGGVTHTSEVLLEKIWPSEKRLKLQVSVQSVCDLISSETCALEGALKEVGNFLSGAFLVDNPSFDTHE